MRTLAILGIIATILTLANFTTLLAAAASTGMDPHTRLMVFSGALAGTALFATLTAVLLTRASA